MGTPTESRHRLRARLNILNGLGAFLLLAAAAIIVFSAIDMSRHELLVKSVPATSAKQVSFTDLLSDIKAQPVSAASLDDSHQLLLVTLDTSPTSGGTRSEYAIVPASFNHDAIAALLSKNVPLQVVASPSASHADSTSGTSAPASSLSALSAGSTRLVYYARGSHNGHTGIAQMWLGTGIFLAVVAAFLIAAGLRRARRAANSDAPAVAQSNSDAVIGVMGTRRRATAGGERGHFKAVAELPTTRFSDVAGCEEAVFDLQELVLFLKDPDRFARTGAERPKGALMVGPPGTGKTLLARAVAGEAGCRFLAVAATEFVEKYVGVGASRVRDLFETARGDGSPAVVFIDEIDAVARTRASSGENGNQESDATLNQILTELDGFRPDSNVLVLAATNRKDMLDPAILRPGRLERHVEVPKPDRRGREKVLEVHARNKPLSDLVDLGEIARRTPGFSGAQLKSLVNEACLSAAREGVDEVSPFHISQAVATIAMGRPRTSALVTEHDARVTAWHEGGHALCGFLQAHHSDPVAISIVPRGPAGGVTWFAEGDEIFLSRSTAHAQLVTAMGGRVGEEMLLGGEYTQGASGDLQAATQTATRMVTEYGMSRLGFAVRQGSGASSAEVTAVVEELLAEAYETASALLRSHAPLMNALADALLERKDLLLIDLDVIAREHGVERNVHVVAPALPVRPPFRVPSSAPAVPAPVAAVERPVARRPRRVRIPVAAIAFRAHRRVQPQPEEPQTATA